jgi:hypothetical protein
MPPPAENLLSLYNTPRNTPQLNSGAGVGASSSSIPDFLSSLSPSMSQQQSLSPSMSQLSSSSFSSSSSSSLASLSQLEGLYEQIKQSVNNLTNDMMRDTMTHIQGIREEFDTQKETNSQLHRGQTMKVDGVKREVETMKNELGHMQQQFREGMNANQAEITRIGAQIQSTIGRLGILEDRVNHIEATIRGGMTNPDYDQRLRKLERIVETRYMEVESI